MSQLNKLQKYAVLWLNFNKKSIEEISKELKLSKDSISKVLEKEQKINLNNKTKTGSESVKNNKIKNLIINETTAKKSRNVAIMTQSASMAADEMKNKKRNTVNPKKNQNTIFKPNG